MVTPSRRYGTRLLPPPNRLIIGPPRIELGLLAPKASVLPAYSGPFVPVSYQFLFFIADARLELIQVWAS